MPLACRGSPSLCENAAPERMKTVLTRKQKGLIALVAATILWMLPPILMRYLKDFFDPHSQNFYRYLSAAVFLVIFTRARGKRLVPDGRSLVRALVATLPNVAFQTCMVASLYYILPTQSNLIMKSSVIFAAIISYVFFTDERRLIRSWTFLAGSLAAMAAVSAFIMVNPAFHWSWSNNTLVGGALAVLAALSWAGYAAVVKRVMRPYEPATAFTWVVVTTTVVLGIMMAVWGRPGAILTAGAGNVAIVIISGLLCIGVAHPVYYYALARLGVALCVTFLLLTPFGVGLLSWMIFGERLSAAQIALGGLILVGAVLTVWSKESPATPETAPPPRG